MAFPRRHERVDVEIPIVIAGMLWSKHRNPNTCAVSVPQTQTEAPKAIRARLTALLRSKIMHNDAPIIRISAVEKKETEFLQQLPAGS